LSKVATRLRRITLKVPWHGDHITALNAIRALPAAA
jgi:hypothetical protein